MKACVSPRLAEAGRLSTERRSPPGSALRTTRFDRPVTSATCSGPKCQTIWSSAAWTDGRAARCSTRRSRSEEHTSELQSLMRISYAVFCLKKKKTNTYTRHNNTLRHNNVNGIYTNKPTIQHKHTINTKTYEY